MSVNLTTRGGRSHGPIGRSRHVLVGGALALAMTVTAGCSSADGDEGASDGGGDSAGLVTEMQGLIDEHSGQPEFEAPGPELDGSQAEGRTIAVIAIDLRVPALTEVTESLKDVAEQIGVTATVFDGQGNPTQVNQGMSRAIDDQVDAIISVGLPVQIIADQIAAAKDAGIPVVDVVNTPPQPDVPGQGSDPNVFGNVAPDSELVGQLLAATAIVQTDGKANVAVMNTSELTASPVLVGGITDTLDRCDSCEYTETDTALVDWATELPGQASSIIRSNSEVNFMLPMYDGMALFATTGVRQAGGTGKVQMASFNGTAAALDLVADGDIMVADPAQNNEWAAWAAMDQALRGMLDMAPADPVLPIRYVGTDDLEGVDTSSQAAVNEALFGTEYRDGFLQLWGL
jgi:ribose transport system substrate-binding protein